MISLPPLEHEGLSHQADEGDSPSLVQAPRRVCCNQVGLILLQTVDTVDSFAFSG